MKTMNTKVKDKKGQKENSRPTKSKVGLAPKLAAKPATKSAPKPIVSKEQRRNNIEAVLLAGGEPISIRQLQDVFAADGITDKEMKELLQQLQKKYESSVMQLVKGASGYSFHIGQKYAEAVQSFQQEKPARYSRALMETLAIIAYKQPVTKSEIEDLRGVTLSTGIMRTLQEHDWIKIIGHKEVPGRPAIWGTTKIFLDNFKLAGLKDLAPLQSSAAEGSTDSADTGNAAAASDFNITPGATEGSTDNTDTGNVEGEGGLSNSSLASDNGK